MTEDARILVVNDEPRNVRLLSAVLGANGHTVTSASSGREVLDRVRTDDPDLLLLDIQMSGMDGYEVCRRLREDPATAFLPVVLITASSSETCVECDEALPGQILVSDRVFAEIEELVEAEPAGAHALKGLDLPVGTHSVGVLRASTRVGG